MHQHLKELKQAEMIKRKFVAPIYFPAPAEGTNKVDVGFGFELVLVHGFNFKIDENSLDSSAAVLRKAGIKVDKLFKYKPALVEAEYRLLTDEQKEKLVGAGVITISESAPDLKIRAIGDPTPEELGMAQAVPIAPTQPPGEIEYVMAPLAGDFTEDDYLKQGWTREMLIDKGFLIPREPETPPTPPKRRGRKPGTKNKKA
jgi:hypothetical protein